MKTRILSLLATTGILISTTFCFMACSDDSNVTEPGGTSSGGTSGSTSGNTSGQTTSGDAGPPKFDAGVDDAGNPKDCFDPPLDSHLKIINACTNADKVVRNPKSKFIVDGGALPKP